MFDKLLALTLPPVAVRTRLDRSIIVTGAISVGLAIAWLPPDISFLVLVGAIILVLLLRQPGLSLFLLIPLIPVSSLLAVPLGNFKAGLMEIVLAFGLIAWLLRLSTRRYFQRQTAVAPPGHRPASLLWPFLLLLGSIALSWLNTLSIGASLIETTKWLEMLALYLFAVYSLPQRQVKWVVAIILLTGVGQAALGLYQFIFKVGPEGFLLFGGRFLRAYGTFAQPNPYAGYLGLILPLALSLTIWAFSGSGFRIPGAINPVDFRSKNKFSATVLTARILLCLVLILLLTALFASQSRAAWLAMIVAATTTIIARSRKPGLVITTITIIAAGIIGLAGVFDWNLNRLTASQASPAYDAITQRVVDAAAIATISDISTLEVNDANFATIERLAHWQAAREMWRDHPWLGVGFGNYAAVYPAYAVGRWLDPLGHAHNYLLNIGAESGLVGVIGYLIFWAFAFKIGWQATRCSRGFYRATAAGSLGILVHLHIHNFFDNLYVQGMYLHIAIILAVISTILSAYKYPMNS